MPARRTRANPFNTVEAVGQRNEVPTITKSLRGRTRFPRLAPWAGQRIIVGPDGEPSVSPISENADLRLMSQPTEKNPQLTALFPQPCREPSPEYPSEIGPRRRRPRQPRKQPQAVAVASQVADSAEDVPPVEQAPPVEAASPVEQASPLETSTDMVADMAVAIDEFVTNMSRLMLARGQEEEAGKVSTCLKIFPPTSGDNTAYLLGLILALEQAYCSPKLVRTSATQTEFPSASSSKRKRSPSPNETRSAKRPATRQATRQATRPATQQATQPSPDPARRSQQPTMATRRISSPLQHHRTTDTTRRYQQDNTRIYQRPRRSPSPDTTRPTTYTSRQIPPSTSQQTQQQTPPQSQPHPNYHMSRSTKQQVRLPPSTPRGLDTRQGGCSCPNCMPLGEHSRRDVLVYPQVRVFSQFGRQSDERP